MRSYFIILVLLFSSPSALGDDFNAELNYQPSAADGLGRMFAYSQILAQALDTMVWYTMFGNNVGGSVPFWQKTGPFCQYNTSSNSSICNDELSTAILADALRREKRRRFHVTLTHLHDIRLRTIRSIDSIGLYYSDKSWGAKIPRCAVYRAYHDIKQDWPRFLTAYRDDRRGLSTFDKEMMGLYFNYAKRAYSDYLDVMNKLLPDLEELCESD